jgi:hypothetical protein
MKPHKHAELIKAWADGAEIEFCGVDNKWRPIEARDWDSNFLLRIKPEPKPDVVRYTQAFMTSSGTWGEPSQFDNLKLTFDGETGELKSARVLK